MNRAELQMFFSLSDYFKVLYNGKEYTPLSFSTREKIYSVALKFEMPFEEAEAYLIKEGILSSNWKDNE